MLSSPGYLSRMQVVSLQTAPRGREEANDWVTVSMGRSPGPGGGRERADAHNPDLETAFMSLIEPATLVDPTVTAPGPGKQNWPPLPRPSD